MSESKDNAGYKPRLQAEYTETIRPALKTELGLKNVMQVPRLQKIVVNMGVGEGTRDEKVLVQAEGDLMAITGQKPRRNNAKVAVAAFKIRKGMPLGCHVTLRGARMYEFLERMIYVAIPRIRDFRGLPSKSFDGRGNYSFGVREHTIFTEIDPTKSVHNLGMDVTFVTNAATDEQARSLLKQFRFPFREA